MMRSFTIKNFRCFDSIAVAQFERVNLIAGKNNSGKTALLEAIFLHLGASNPGLALNLNAFRGIQQVSVDAEAMWGWLFSGKDINKTIELACDDSVQGSRVLRIRLVEPTRSPGAPSGNGFKIPSEVLGSITTANVLRELVFEYEDSSGQKGVSRAFPYSPVPEVARLKPFAPGVYLSTTARFPREDAERFSKLKETGQDEEIITTLRLLDDRLEELAVLASNGTTMIHGDIGIGRLVPIPNMGEGVARLLSIILAIASAPGGTVLIDEVENGLHYSVMKDVWKAIAHAARQANVQVFATTHSWECIQAAHNGFKESAPYELRYFRLDRLGNQIEVKSLNEHALTRIQATDLEIR